MSSPASWWFASCCVVAAGCTLAPRQEPALPAAPLHEVRSWAIQLQGLEREGARQALAAAGYDMVVIEPTRSVRGMEEFPTRATVAEIRASRGGARAHKLCLAYVNIGQAEDYRDYWQPGWRAPSTAGGGDPAFLLALDPDGWPGNYPVAFWREPWRAIATAAVTEAVADGFDGVYLDWVLGYADPAVMAAAQRDGVDAPRAMVDLLGHLRARARALRPGFLLIAQNAAGLLARDPRLAGVVDAVAQEDLSFRGEAGAGWDEPGAGDVATAPEDAAAIAAHLRACRARGLAVFTLDYAREPRHAESAVQRSRALGGVPCISRVALDRLPATPATPPPR